MKNVLKKFKKVIIGIIVGVITLPNKIFATDAEDVFQYASLYGVPKASDKLIYIYNIIRVIIMPVAILIGLIIYFKKSKSTKKKKIIITICAIAIAVIVFYVLGFVLMILMSL